MRIILTFKNLNTTLQVQKLLHEIGGFNVRPVPTPPQASIEVCSICLEVLTHTEEAAILNFLANQELLPIQVIKL